MSLTKEQKGYRVMENVYASILKQLSQYHKHLFGRHFVHITPTVPNDDSYQQNDRNHYNACNVDIENESSTILFFSLTFLQRPNSTENLVARYRFSCLHCSPFRSLFTEGFAVIESNKAMGFLSSF